MRLVLIKCSLNEVHLEIQVCVPATKQGSGGIL